VGVGSGADRTLLTMIAERGGGRFYFTQDAQNVPKIFTKETSQVARSSVVEEPVRPRLAKNADFLQGIPIEAAPALKGYVGSKPKAMTELILQTSSGDPLLVRGRLGLGQTAYFASDVKNRWATPWLSWPHYGKFWAQFIRASMRHRSGAGLPGYELRAEVDSPDVRITVDAIGKNDQFISGLESTLYVEDPAQPKSEVLAPTVMTATASGRYEAQLRLDKPGA
jgi:hypothetical protein